MEKKFLKYTLIIIIFFVGLSLGVTYQDNNRTRDIQREVSSWESGLPVTGTNTNGNSEDFTAVVPKKIEHNLFSSLAKDGEYLIKKGLDLVLSKSDDFIKFIFGKK